MPFARSHLAFFSSIDSKVRTTIYESVKRSSGEEINLGKKYKQTNKQRKHVILISQCNIISQHVPLFIESSCVRFGAVVSKGAGSIVNDVFLYRLKSLKILILLWSDYK